MFFYKFPYNTRELVLENIIFRFVWPSKNCVAWSTLTMASATGTKYKQDMPPKGGYGPVDYSRKLFNRIKGKLWILTMIKL